MGPAAVSLTLSSPATLIDYMIGCIVVLSHFHFDVAPFLCVQQICYSTLQLNIHFKLPDRALWKMRF